MFWSCIGAHRQKEGHGEAKRFIFAIFICELTRKIGITKKKRITDI
jgi:hypothetical protein